MVFMMANGNEAGSSLGQLEDTTMAKLSPSTRSSSMEKNVRVNTGHRIVECTLVRRGNKIIAVAVRDCGAALKPRAAAKKLPAKRLMWELNELALAARTGDAAKTVLGT